MPFIIATSYRQLLQADAVDFVNAGEDQNLICASDAVLTATVVGTLSGHTTIWEQISGSPVAFNTPVDNELSVSFTQFDFDDKVFRFTVDKGYPSEKYDEITTFGTPTDKHQMPGQISKTSLIRQQAPLMEATAALLSTHRTEVYVRDLPYPKLLWSFTDSLAKVKGFEIQYRESSGGWITEATTSPSTTQYIPVDGSPDALYRVVAILQTPNATFSVPAKYVDRKAVSADLVYVADSHSIGNQINKTSVIKTLTTDVLFLTKLAPIEEPTHTGQSRSSASVMKTLATEVLYLTTVPTETDQTEISTNQPLTTSRMKSFAVEDLQSGSVGG